MRLLSWSSRATWKGWQGRALTWQHIHAGCTGSKFCTPPTSSLPGQTLNFFPPCRSCLVASMIASVAQLMLAGSSSRGLVCGTAGELCFPMMWRPRMPGSTITSTRTQWTYCWFRPTRTSRWQMTWCPKTFTDCSSGAQRVTLGNWAWARCSSNGGAGSDVWARMSSCRPSSSRVPQSSQGASDPGQHGGERVPGLLEGQDAGVLQLGTACTECGDPTRRVRWTCCVGMCSACYTWRQPCELCGGRKKMFAEGWYTEAAPLRSPQHQAAKATMQHRRQPHPRQGATLHLDGERPTL